MLLQELNENTQGGVSLEDLNRIQRTTTYLDQNDKTMTIHKAALKNTEQKSQGRVIYAYDIEYTSSNQENETGEKGPFNTTMYVALNADNEILDFCDFEQAR